MQGPNYQTLAAPKISADMRLNKSGPRRPYSPSAGPTTRTRAWIGRQLIHIGERIVPHPRELQLEVSTGPPCP